MASPLIAVLDETGTYNVPQVDPETDFAFGGFIAEEQQLEKLRQISREIGEVVQSRDYKYKHVQRSTLARKLFLRAVRMLIHPCGVFAMYSAGGALLEERIRTQKAFARIGGEEESFSDEIERLRSNDGNTHLLHFLGYFAPCFVRIAERARRTIRVCWDQRSDLPRIQAHCDEQGQFHATRDSFGDSKVSFGHVADRELTSIGRLAGVLASDVRFFFRKHGNRIWPHLRPEGHGDQAFLAAATSQDINNVYALTQVAILTEKLADPDFGTESKETCMLQGYSKHFAANSFSFAAPTGIMGHVFVEHGSRWRIHQVPD